MYTYQDLQKLGGDLQKRIDFVYSLITMHKASNEYVTARDAKDYARHQNKTIKQYEKTLTRLSGKVEKDPFGANYKLISGYFDRFVTQQNQYLLGNGVNWADKASAEAKLGLDFDYKLQKAGHAALVCGASFGFYNNGEVYVFDLTDFAPLYDENTGALRAGVRFYQLEAGRPLHATLYEEDGYTEFTYDLSKEKSQGYISKEKTTYVIEVHSTEADGIIDITGRNYTNFPIVPLYANEYHQSELVGIRERIDCIDLISSGYANNVDEASLIYWTIKNAGGMDDIDLAEFINKIKTLHAANVRNADEGAEAEPHQIEAPYQSREALLDRLEKDLYRDFMALDTDRIAGGQVTATQIKASYEPLNNKADRYEYQVIEFIKGLMALAGIEGEKPTFTRSVLLNVKEEIETIVNAAQYLSEEYITQKVLTLLGDGDKFDEVNKAIVGDSLSR